MRISLRPVTIDQLGRRAATTGTAGNAHVCAVAQIAVEIPERRTSRNAPARSNNVRSSASGRCQIAVIEALSLTTSATSSQRS
jgi:hypothetical protein